MTRASPSMKLPRTAKRTQANKTSNVNVTRTGIEVVEAAPPEELKKRAKMGSVVAIISRIKEVAEAVAVARTTNLSSSREEVEVELKAMDSLSINRRNIRLVASRISHRVQLHTIKVQPKCKQDLLKRDLREVVWDKTKALK